MSKNKHRVPLLIKNVRNLNGRIYTDKSVNEITAAFNTKKDKGHTVLGEMGHPESFETSLSNVVIHTESLELDESNDILYGNVVTMDNKSLKLSKDDISDMIESGTVVVRARCRGNIDEQGNVTISKLFAFDLILAETDAFKNLI